MLGGDGGAAQKSPQAMAEYFRQNPQLYLQERQRTLEGLNPALAESSLQGEVLSRDAAQQGRSGNVAIDRKTGKMVLQDDDAMGGEGELYWWGQNDNDVTVSVGKLPLGVRARDISLKMTPSTLRLGVLGMTVLDGELFAKVKPDESTFELEERHGSLLLVVTLAKLKRTTGVEHWRCVVKGEPEADPSRHSVKVTNVNLLDPRSIEQLEDLASST